MYNEIKIDVHLIMLMPHIRWRLFILSEDFVLVGNTDNNGNYHYFNRETHLALILLLKSSRNFPYDQIKRCPN